MDDKIRDECGLFAVAGHPMAVELCYYGLYALQHRGQESAGMTWREDGALRTHREMGLVSDVFTPQRVQGMHGDCALGHVRYSTAGQSTVENAQPLSVKMWRGQFALAHNGNLVNAGALKAELERKGSIFQTTSDSEVVSHLVAQSDARDTLSALASALGTVRGAYSILALSEEGVFAAKDPHGFRPLCFGIVDGAYVFSSETCGLDAVGAQFIREVEPGEILYVPVPSAPSPGGRGLEMECTKSGIGTPSHLCAFEFIYFARPDSDIYGLNVHKARKELGRCLARRAPVEADLVTGVPDSSLSAASGFAEEAGIPYEMGLVKNRYIGRTFISPEQSLREFAVKIKINPLRSLVEGKRVVLVDDSIVRGTTSRYIVGLLRSAGASEVHLRISSPPYRFPCYYGIDTSSKGELISATMDEQGVRRAIGADSLAYLDTDDLRQVLGERIRGFCYSCFTGDYPVKAN